MKGKMVYQFVTGVLEGKEKRNWDLVELIQKR